MKSAAFALLGAILLTGTAQAQRGRGPSPDEVRQMLASDDRDEVQAGIEAVGLSGSARLVSPLADRIRRGLPAELLDAAIDTLGVLARPEAGPVLFELVSHRRADVRRKAVEAIVACGPRGGADALVTALSDPDPAVRGHAAQGLGQLEARDRIDTLFLALDRGILEAAISIGQLAGPSHVDRILGYLGRIPFDAVRPALEEMLARDDLATDAKLQLVSRLAELATAGVRAFLTDFLDALPDEARNRQLRDAIQAAIDRIAG